MIDTIGKTEDELLEILVTGLTLEHVFALGQLIGTISKRHRQLVNQLECRIRELEAQGA